jgi:L-alanine-DL-glutamate epimerase-like enolase superfamily enzyme
MTQEAFSPCWCDNAAKILQRGWLFAMRITDAKVTVCSPGRNFVTLKIITEDGVHGLGDGTLNGREPAGASYCIAGRVGAKRLAPCAV